MKRVNDMWILGVLAVISAFAFAWFSILAIKDFIKKDKKKLKTNIIKAVVCMVIFYIGIFAAMAKSGSAGSKTPRELHITKYTTKPPLAVAVAA